MIFLEWNMEYVVEKAIWEPLSHHTVVHNVTQARPGWSVAPTNIQGRKQESLLLIFPIFRSVKIWQHIL